MQISIFFSLLSFKDAVKCKLKSNITLALLTVLHGTLFRGKQMAKYLSRVTAVIMKELMTPHT